MKILIATGGSEYARCALDFMLRFPFPRDSKMTLLNVVNAIPMSEEELGLLNEDQSEMLEDANEYLMKDAEELVAGERKRLLEDGWPVESMVKKGSPVDQILHVAKEIKADLIVLGSHGSGRTKRFLLGSVCDYVMEHAPCSVLIVKPKSCSVPQPEIEPGTNAPYQITVAYDHTPVAKDVLKLCASFPLEETSKINVVYVMPVITMYRQDIRSHINSIWMQKEQMMKEQLDKAVKEHDWAVPDVTTQLREADSISDELLNAAEETQSDLIMIGYKDKGVIQRFIQGSASHRMARYGDSTVWVVRKKRKKG